MTHVTKRKYVEKELLYEFVVPEKTQFIVMVKHCRGNNLHEVWDENGQEFLVSMPPKFRKHFYIKKGMFLIVEPILEGVKVKAEIIRILYKEQINYIKSMGKWPEPFSKFVEEKKDEGQIPDDMLPPSDSDSEAEDLGCLVNNYNRYVYPAHIPVSDSDDDDEEDEEEEEDDDDDGPTSEEITNEKDEIEEKEAKYEDNDNVTKQVKSVCNKISQIDIK